MSHPTFCSGWNLRGCPVGGPRCPLPRRPAHPAISACGLSMARYVAQLVPPTRFGPVSGWYLRAMSIAIPTSGAALGDGTSHAHDFHLPAHVRLKVRPGQR
jgi:hypothetical protein